MTLLALMTLALAKSGEDTDEAALAQYRNALTQYVNEAYCEIARFREKLFLRETLCARNGCIPYPSFQKRPVYIIGLRAPGGGALPFDCLPEGVIIRGVDGEVTAEYYYLPEALVNDADAPEIPEYAHAALSDYAAYRLLSGEGAESREKAQFYLSAWLRAVSQMGLGGKSIRNKY